MTVNSVLYVLRWTQKPETSEYWSELYVKDVIVNDGTHKRNHTTYRTIRLISNKTV